MPFTASLWPPAFERFVAQDNNHRYLMDVRRCTLYHEELDALKRQSESLTIIAPHAGFFAQFDPALDRPIWIAEGQEIGVIIDKSTPEIVALVPEEEAKRLIENAKAKFIPSDPKRPVIKLKNPKISQTASRTIYLPMLTNKHGGSINVVEGKDNTLIAQKGYVQLTFASPDGSLTDRDLQGVVHLKVERQSLAQKAIQQIARVLIREIN